MGDFNCKNDYEDDTTWSMELGNRLLNLHFSKLLDDVYLSLVWSYYLLGKVSIFYNRKFNIL